MTSTLRRWRKPIAAFIVRWRLVYAFITVMLNALAIALVVLVFPNVSNLWVSIFVLFSGFTAALTGLADILVDEEDVDGEP